MQEIFFLHLFFVGILKVNDENRRIRIHIRIHIKMSWIRNTDSSIFFLFKLGWEYE